jgi:hypothetical protein
MKGFKKRFTMTVKWRRTLLYPVSCILHPACSFRHDSFFFSPSKMQIPDARRRAIDSDRPIGVENEPLCWRRRGRA